MPNNKTTFTAAANRAVYIATEFIFNESTVDWAPIVNYAISDMNDHVWFYGSLTNSPLSIQSESSPIIDSNVNSFTLDVCGSSTSDMAITTAKANIILDYILGGVSFTLPVNFYLGVSSTTISADGVGITEPAAADYSRVVLPNSKVTFTNAANFSVTLASQVKFSSALVDWGTFTHFFVSDTPTGENVWWCGKMNSDRSVEIGTTLVLNSGGFNWILGNCV
jgi:hypothetical protein